MNTLEQQIKDLQETVKLLYAVVIEGKPYVPGSDEYFNVVRPALMEGDIRPLIAFYERGGIIPDDVPSPKQSRGTHVYKPRKRVERPKVGKPTNASGNRNDIRSQRMAPSCSGPVMLPAAKERGAVFGRSGQNQDGYASP